MTAHRVLENHGYAVAAERLAAFVPELGGAAALRESHKRQSWRRLLRRT